MTMAKNLRFLQQDDIKYLLIQSNYLKLIFSSSFLIVEIGPRTICISQVLTIEIHHQPSFSTFISTQVTKTY